MSEQLVEVTCHIHQTTHRDVLVSRDGNAGNGCWLRLAQIEIAMKTPPLAMIAMPEWLAKERGLV